MSICLYFQRSCLPHCLVVIPCSNVYLSVFPEIMSSTSSCNHSMFECPQRSCIPPLSCSHSMFECSFICISRDHVFHISRPGFVNIQNWKNSVKKLNITIMFPFYNLFKVHYNTCQGCVRLANSNQNQLKKFYLKSVHFVTINNQELFKPTCIINYIN